MAGLDTLLTSLRAFGSDRSFGEQEAQDTQVLTNRRTQDLLGGIRSAATAEERNPLLEQLSAVNPAVAKQTISNFQDLDEQRQKAMFQDAFRVRQKLDSDPAGALDIISDRVGSGRLVGADMADTQEIGDLISAGNIEQAKQELDTFISFGAAKGLGPAATAESKNFNELLKAAGDESDPLRQQAARIKLGIDPRATGAASITIAQTPGLTQEVAGSEAIIKGQTALSSEAGRLTAQAALAPEVQSAVTSAVELAKNTAKQIGNDRSATKALDLYNVAIGGLEGALSGTETGPVVGRLPSLTANQQIADGAVAAMAPILKQMFRAAGEGVFTDRDQDLLLQMIPTRTTLPAARDAQLKALDSIVRAKLSPESVPGPGGEELPQSRTLVFNPETGQLE